MTATILGVDPYQAWLNVRSVIRPLDPYTLLGLQPLEENPARIQAAITRQKKALLERRPGADPQVWDRVHRELQDAIDNLTDHERKAILDAGLRRKGSAKSQQGQGGPVAAVPRGEATVGITCRHCQQPNLPDRSFCAGCGKSLWDTCPNCQALYATSERFCGGCGINLSEFLTQQCQHWEERIAAGRQLQAAYRFIESQIVLREVAKLDDPRYDDLAQLATELMRQFAAEREQLERSIQSAMEQARNFVQSHAFDRAVAVLEAIPEGARSPELRELLRDARDRSGEIQTLLREVRAALDAQKTFEVFPKLERLLVLKPDYAQAKQLGQQLAARMVVGAKKLLAEQNFDDAAKLLREIPTFARNAELEKLSDQAAEARWLLHEMRTSPLLTRTLLAIADRTLKTLPNHLEVMQLQQRMIKQVKQGVPEPWRAASDWTAPPARTALEFPIDWRGGFQRIVGGDVGASTQFREHPGRWYVACGLALQGLGKAAIETSLLPREKSGLLSKLSISFRRKTATAAWGLDLSPSGLKAIKLRWDEARQEVHLEACEFIEHDWSQESAGDETLQVAEKEATLAAFLAKHTLGNDKICVNLPGLEFLGRFLQIPSVAEKRFDDMVSYEVRQQIPYPFDELTWDYECLEDRPEQSAELSLRRVLVIAAKERHVRQRLAPFHKLKLKVDAVQGDAVALHNLIRFELASDEPTEDLANAPSQATVAVLDVGSDITNLVVSGPDTVWFRSLTTASDEGTKALVRDFRLTRAQAEQVKREPVRARRLSQLFDTLHPTFARLVDEVQRSLDAYHSSRIGPPVSRMYCVGGGAQIHGLMRHLRSGH